MSEFKTGDAVRVRPEVDLNKLFGSVTWPDGNIEGVVVGKALGDCYYVDFPQFRNESPVGFWPIYGHELDAIPDDLARLQAENKRLRDALKTVLRKANSLAGYYPEPGDEREAYGMDAPIVFDDIRKTARVALEGVAGDE